MKDKEDSTTIDWHDLTPKQQSEIELALEKWLDREEQGARGNKMKIETDIPVPMTTRNRKYPFLDMKVGESIWFDEPVNGRAYRSALSTGTRHGLKFVTRREHSGIRIWRSE
jgi:hypothetical protein